MLPARLCRLARPRTGRKNRQDIFEDQEDYVRFLTCMQQMLEPYDDLGNRLPPLCTFYAYCLMSNHVHLLMVWDGVWMGGYPFT